MGFGDRGAEVQDNARAFVPEDCGELGGWEEALLDYDVLLFVSIAFWILRGALVF